MLSFTVTHLSTEPIQGNDLKLQNGGYMENVPTTGF